jgi:hypothetical protein
VTVTATLGHVGGHAEETTMTLPHDSSGSKNAVQAIGSSTSYGKRYTALSLLNITTRGEDDDGNGGSSPGGVVTEDDLMKLREMIEAVDANENAFCRFLRIDKLTDLPAARFPAAMEALREKGRRTGRLA